VAIPIDPSSAAFLYAENRSMPMHVGGLQLFKKPPGAGRNFGQEWYHQWRDVDEIAPLFLKHPTRSLTTAGQWVWAQDELFDLDHHVRHSALPKPGRVRELLDLCSRLHGTRLAYERPLWEAHVIEGLHDGRVALYTKIHHALVDGVSSMRLLQSVLSSDPDRRDMPPPWAARPRVAKTEKARDEAEQRLADLPIAAFRTALDISADAAGLPGALVKSLSRSARSEASPISFHAPKTMLNQPITGARRFAAQDWEIERMRAIGKATGTTINDVVLAMCGGALRTYLLDFDALPVESLVSMVPVSLHGRSHSPDQKDGGNAVGAVMVQLATEVEDAGARLARIHKNMKDGKDAMSTMTPLQILALSAIGMSPVLLNPLLKATGVGRPPFNVIISNVPGPRTTQYINGAELLGTYPLSIPFHGNALNITCTSYAGTMGFGLTGCRRTVPHLQRLLTHLDVELRALEKAAGV
jgi:diacylglycerol O-acyltransferase / wax synthase